MEKGGVDSGLFKGIDKDITKAESVITEMLAQINKGFSDTKEIAAFGKKISTLDGVLTKIGTGLGQINVPESFKKGTKEIQELTSKLEESKKNFEDLKQKAIDFASQQAKSHRLSKEEADQIREAVKNEQDLYDVIKRINTEKEKGSRQKITSAYGKMSDDVKASVQTSFQSSELDSKLEVKSIGFSEGALSTESLKQYRAALLDIVKGEKTVEQAFKGFVSGLNDTDKEILEQERFIKAYTEDLRTLAHAGLDQATSQGLLKPEDRTSLKRDVTQGARGLAAAGTSPTGMSLAPELAKYNEGLQQTTQQTEELERRTEEFQQSVRTTMSAAASGIEDATSRSHQLNEAGQKNVDTMQEEAAAQENLNKTFNNLQNIVKQVLSLTSAWRGLKRILTQTYQDVTKLDKAFAQIAMVTSYSVGDMWAQYSDYASMANKLGQSTESVIQASGLFYQQGLDTAEALSLTEDTMKLATLANLDFQESTSLMTAALRAFHMEMDQGSHITDVYAELAAHAAADVQGIAYAMSKTASIANSAGMSFENTSAFLTQMIETTQEAPENIGTAMKTIIARFTELKENVAGTTDSEFDDLDYNKVDKALKSVGVSLKDATGQFRNLDDVFLELSAKWDTLDRNSQRYIATIAAGSRQQSRFIAMMENYDRTLELIETAQDSAGKSSQQFAKYQDTVEYKVNQLKNSWESLRISFADSNFFKNALDGLNKLLDKINNFSIGDFATFGILFLTVGKYAAQNLIKGFQESSKAISQGITNAVSKGTKAASKVFSKVPFVAKIKTSIDEKKLQRIRQQIDQLTNENHDLQVSTYTAEENLRRTENEIQKVQKEIDDKTSVHIDTTEAEAKLLELKRQAESFQNTINNNKGQINSNNAQLSDLQADENALISGKMTAADKKNAQMRGQAIGTVLATTITTAFTSYTMREKPGEVFGDIIKAGIMAIIPMLISTVAMAGGEITATFIASTAGLGAILLGITLAIAGLAAGIKALSNSIQKNAEKTATQNSMFYAASKELDRLQESQEKLNETLDKANEKYDKAKDAYDYATDAREKFEQLNNTVGMSVEEQKEFLATQQEIASEIPELIDHYDEEGNAILTSLGGAWDEVLNKKKAYYEEAAQEQSFAELQANTGNLLIAQTELAKEEGFVEDIQKDWIQAFAQIKDANRAGSDGQIFYDEDKNQWYRTGEYGVRINLSDKDNKQGGSLTMQGVLNALESGEKEEYGLILQEALQRSDPSGKLAKAVKSYGSGKEVIAKIQELLSEGNEKDEQQIRGELSKAITNSSDVNLSEKMKNLKEAEKNFEDSMSNMVESYALSSDTYADASKNVQRLMIDYQADSLGLTYEEVFEKFKNSADFKDEWLDKDGSVKSEFLNRVNIEFQNFMENSADELGISSKSIDTSLSKEFTATRQEYLNNFYKKVEEESLGIVEQLEEIQSTNVLSDEIKKIWIEQHQTQIDTYNQNAQAIAEILGEKGNIDANGIWKAQENTFMATLQELNTAAQDLVFKHIQAVKQAQGEVAAKEYAEELANFKETQGLDDNTFAQLLNLNIDNVDAASYETWIKNQVKTFKDAGIEISEDALRTFAGIQDKYGEITLTLTSEAGLTSMISQLQELQKAWTDQQDTFVDVITAQENTGEITLKQYDTLKKTLADLNEDISDYVNITDDGHIVANAEALDKLYREQAFTLDEQLKAQVEKIDEEITSLKNEQAILAENYEIALSQIDQLANINDINENLQDQLALVGSIGRAMGTLTQEEYDALGVNYLDTQERQKKIADMRANAKASYEEQNAAIQVEIDSREELKANIQKEAEEQEKLNKVREQSYDSDKQDKIDEYTKKVENLTEKELEAAKAEEKAWKAVLDAQDKVAESYKKLEEAKYGTANRGPKNDALYNYTTNLERLTKLTDDAKSKLEDLQDWDNAEEVMQDYLDNIHKETVTGAAKAQVYQSAIINGQNSLDKSLAEQIAKINKERGTNITTELSDLYTKVGDRYNIDYDKLNKLKIPDEFKDRIEEEIASWNKNLDEIDKIQEQKLKRQKEFNQLYKNALKNMVDLQEEMKNALKEKYEQEIEDVENKYQAMEDADNEYVDALEAAIQKQRDLRERENQWSDLADKKRKLSLMQRDTSGGNLVETRQLEKEVQDDRQELLDNSIDDIINGLKEMYELQKESRDAEIEYRKALIDEGLLMQEVTAALANIDTAEDLVAWFYENTTDLSSMSTEQIELEKMSWQDLFNAKLVYLEASQADFENALEVSENEIQTTVKDTSENLTKEAERALAETSQKVDDNIKSAQNSLSDALTNLDEKWEAYNKAVDAHTEATDALTEATKKFNAQADLDDDPPKTSPSSTKKISDINTNTTAGYEQKKGIEANARKMSKEEFTSKYSSYSDAESYWNQVRGYKNTVSPTAPQVTYNKPKKVSIEEAISDAWTHEPDDLVSDGQSNNISEDEWLESEYSSQYTWDEVKKAMKKALYEEYKGKIEHGTESTYYAAENDNGTTFYYGPDAVHSNSLATKKIDITKYAQGGLVDFTGPAWVDGTKSRPEAFLSADDTKRIGEAAKLLSNLPLLDNASWEKNEVTNTNVGDTVIDIHINIENVSSDYDVDQAVDRVKQDIVDAANYAGSNVILRKH